MKLKVIDGLIEIKYIEDGFIIKRFGETFKIPKDEIGIVIVDIKKQYGIDITDQIEKEIYSKEFKNF